MTPETPALSIEKLKRNFLECTIFSFALLTFILLLLFKTLNREYEILSPLCLQFRFHK